MPAMLLLIVVLSLLGTVAITTTDNDRSAASSMLESQRAFYAAEAGMNAILEQWNQDHYDTIIDRPGDSTVVGWTSIENGCAYLTNVRRIDAGYYRRFYSVTSTGRGEGLRGGQRTVTLILRERFIIPGNALTSGGNITITGTANIVGQCGNVHANGPVFGLGSNVTVSGGVSGSGIVTGTPEDTLGNPVTPQTFQPQQEIPDLDPLMHCQTTNYWLRGNYLVRVATNDSLLITGGGAGGWRYNGTVYSTTAAPPASGTYCATDDINVGTNIGTEASPLGISLLSSHSIDVGGNPRIFGVHPEGILLMAGGDVRITGTAGGVAQHYEGLIYADAQCELNGTVRIEGNFLCRNGAQPVGSNALALETRIVGTATIRYDCNTSFQGDPVEPIRERAWGQILD